MTPIPALMMLFGLCACAPASSPTMAAPRLPVTPEHGMSSLATSSVNRGGAFAQANCAGCHALGPAGASPLAAAPPLREISSRYPVEDLSEAFAEGFVSSHSTMPEFILDAGQNRDLIAYLTSIQTK